MPYVERYLPGQFCWMELGTTDDGAATAFYSELFDWRTEAKPVENGGSYTMLRKSGRDLGGLYELMPEQTNHGVPPHWLGYVSVEGADHTAQRATALGGKLVMPPMDVMDSGRMAVLTDPAGAVFAIWQPFKHQGAQLTGEPGTACWHELITRDVDRAAAFYCELFDWKCTKEPKGPVAYTMASCSGQPAAGMVAPASGVEDASSYWMLYLAVADCDEDVRRGRQLGASLLAKPSDIPGVGRMAVLQDPQGACFAIAQFAGRTD